MATHDTPAAPADQFPAFLRLFADGSPRARPNEIRLREAFEEFLLPQLKRAKRSQSHISRYWTVLGHWERLTNNPPVSAIDDQAFQAFADAMLDWHKQREERGNENTRKAVAYIHSILRTCCPRGHSNRRGQPGGKHIIDEMPIAYPPEEDPRKKRIADLESIGRAYEAAKIAKWPHRPERVALWRMLFVLSYTYGLRTGDLTGLTWQAIHREKRCPAEEISGLHWPHGWLVFRPAKTRRLKPSVHLPLTECARLHLEKMRPGPDPAGPIFGFTKNPRDFNEQRQLIWREAGIDPPYTFQDLRKTCSTAWNDLCPRLGEHVLGHAPRGVNAVHYDSDIRRLCRFVPQLPQPRAFLEAVGLEAQTQEVDPLRRLSGLDDETMQLVLQLAAQIAKGPSATWLPRDE